jgi:hypothetical protein
MGPFYEGAPSGVARRLLSTFALMSLTFLASAQQLWPRNIVGTCPSGMFLWPVVILSDILPITSTHPQACTSVSIRFKRTRKCWFTAIVISTNEFCPTGGSYQASVADQYDLNGAWGAYYPSYGVSGASTEKNPGALKPHLDRLDLVPSVSMEGDGANATARSVPNWRTTLGPAAFEWENASSTGWYNNLFFDWQFRIVAPCSGQYQFQVTGDGMHCALSYCACR